MISGIYLVSFVANNNTFGEGIVVVKDGSVNGADATYLYRGHLDYYGDGIKASVEVKHYRGPINSVLGPIKQFNLSLSGKLSGNNFQVSGGMATMPSVSITITGSKIADLAE
ncbi:MAG: hypothetical protein LLF28_05515 [Nitrospiraceae bacterium]|nr:hypothetical protein [Nitrospiraceae bacterium]